jgi:hypothetical protein
VSKDGHLQNHALQLEEEIRWLRRVGAAPSTATDEENRKLKQLVADLSLGKAMLQDALQKKL